jgi:two-component system, cell cycle sensor histidine kinase and response regulator CckA
MPSRPGGPEREIARLRQRLEETEAALAAVIAGQIDAASDPRTPGNPLLLQQAQRALRQSEERYRLLFQRNLAGLSRSTLGGSFLDVNHALAAISGFPREELLDRRVQDLVDDRELRERLVAELTDRSFLAGVELPIRRRDGTRAWVLANLTLADDPDGTPVVEATMVDITARKEAEQALEQLSGELERIAARQAAVLDALPAQVALLDGAGTIVAVNTPWRRFADASGFTGADHGVGLNYLAVCEAAAGVDPEAGDVADGLRAVLAGTRRRFEIEYPCHTPESQRWYRMSATALPDRAPGAVVMHVEVTEQHLAAAAVARSEQRFRALVENSAEGVSMVAGDGTVIYVSPGVERMLGFPPSDLVGTSFTRWIHPDDQEIGQWAMQHVLANPGQPLALHLRARHSDGSWRQLRLVATNWLHAEAVGALVCNFEDVTDRHRAQLALAESEQQLRAVFEGSLDAMVIADDQGRYLDANPAACRLFGVPLAELRRLTGRDFTPPGIDYDAAWNAFVAAGSATGQYRVLRPDGGIREVEFAATANVLPGRHLSVLRDVTERHQAAQRLRQTERRLRLLFESGLMGIVFGDAAGPIDANDAWLAITGRDREELRARAIRWRDITPPEYHGADRRAADQVHVHGTCTPYEKEYLRPDGTRVWVLVGFTLLDPAEGATVGFVLDIDARKRAEAAAARSESRFEALLRSSPVALAITEMETGRFVDMNDRFVELVGRPREELVGRTGLEFGIWNSPDDRARILALLREAGSVRNLEVAVTSPAGTPMHLLASIERVEPGPGQPPLLITFLTDVTGHRALEDQLRQSQKMEAVGQLAGGVAHDFNNFLAVVMGYSELLAEQLSPHSDGREYLQVIRDATSRAASLTHRLLAFSRKQVLQPVVVSLNEIVAGLEPLLRRLIGEDVELTMEFDPDLPHVLADPSQIEQAIMNLAVNARDAMPRGGQFTVRTADAWLDEGSAASRADLAPGRYAGLFVSDTGTGMPPEVRERVFEPFFTTKAPGQGTGLGLAMVYGFVRQSGGHVWVYSEPGQGTTFKLLLPAATATAAAPAAPAAPDRSLGGTETILLVEDEPALRQLTEAILVQRGYRVITAADGTEAVDLASAYTERIDLLLTDVVMPGLSGREAADRIVAGRPGLRILYMSGYTTDTVIRHGVSEATVAFIEKPFTPDALARRVREVLDT